MLADGGPPLDGVLLCLHGSLVAESDNDAEGTLLAAVRALVGAETPVVATLDLHCHITDRMLDSADAFAVYHTYPHIDSRCKCRIAASLHCY